MPTAYTFVASHRSTTGTTTSVHAYCGQYALAANSLAAHIAAHAQDPAVTRAVIIAPEFLRDHVFQVMNSAEFKERLPIRLRDDDSVRAFLISSSAGGQLCDRTGTTIECPDAFREHLQFEGMRQIFGDHNPVLDGTPFYHFRKPSGAHSARFIRIADALNDCVEVEFVGVWILRHLTPDIRAIFCDTASIAAVAYSAVNLYSRFFPASDPIEVNTFHSFEFVRDEKAAVRSDALYVISVTTAARLESDLITKGIDPSHIVTLYSVSSDPARGAVLCDLTKTPYNSAHASVAPIENYSAESCPLCRVRMPLVEIMGDQFLPVTTHVEAIVPVAEDAPPWLNALLEQHAGFDVFSCHFGKGAMTNIHDLYVRVPAMIRRESLFGAELIKHLQQGLPASLSTIFHLGDSASEQLGRIAQHLYGYWTGSDVALDRLEAATVLKFGATSQRGAVAVMSSAVSTGRQILTASQLLRDLMPDGRVVFFIALLRARSRERAQRLRSNLTYTPSRHYRFALHVVEEINLPDNTPETPSVWTDEVDFIKRTLVEFPTDDRAVRAQLDARIDDIQRSLNPDCCGLVENAFWPATDGHKLALRSNFSLFHFDYRERAISQADVFCAVSALLHRMRTDKAARSRLIQTPYKRVIFQAESFDRFSDGVVQAALIRAAQPSELDYTLDASRSCEMAGVLDGVLRASRTPHGEACVEFLLAYCMGKIRMRSGDLRAVLEANQRDLEAEPLKHYLIRYLMRSLETKNE